MRLDKLPLGEAIVGFLLVMLVITFLVARHEVSHDEAVAVEGSPTGSAGPTAAPGEAEITMTDNKFDNASLTLKAGEAVSIPLTNKGAAVHNVHVAGADGSYPDAFCTVGGENPCSDPNRLPGGGTGTLAFTVPDAPGTELSYRCDFHPNEMTGKITIQ